MADMYSSKKRSEIMGRILSRNTGPEVRVRRVLHRMGCRFRLHRKDLPGKPDIVLPKWKTVILVHGCFWHGHDCCEGHIPKSNSAYWAPKLARNRRRDIENAEKLRLLGWKRIVVWECETGSLTKLEKYLRTAMLTAEPEEKADDREACLSDQPSPDAPCPTTLSPSSVCFAEPAASTGVSGASTSESFSPATTP
jgi:DNA mismatch endonuclease, patch repair protein